MTISLGPQKVAIPDVDGMDESIATITIRRTGLKVGDIAAIPYAYAAENTVIAQTPQARAMDVQVPRIGILTAQPPLSEDDGSVMPDLTGEPFTTAAMTIIHAGFEVAPLGNPANGPPTSTATNQPALAAPPAAPRTGTASASSGIVIAQFPVAGSRVLFGTTIQLTVQP